MSKTIAIVLAAGQGKRMKTDVAKQFLELNGKLLICYALEAFENSSVIDEVILVTNESALTFCREEIINKNGYKKVKKIVTGGKERYDSVYAGLSAIEAGDYVFIHDGARPFLTEELIERLQESVACTGACVAAVPVKDTIKVADENQYAVCTPERKTLWQIQTPQVFALDKIKAAYEKMMQTEHSSVTDDAMVLETYGEGRVKLVESSYMNIKITTPEDLITGAAFLEHLTQ